ncbi:MAG: hypothetical protein ACI4NV_05980 [Thermoguttaceae bacterium]
MRSLLSSHAFSLILAAAVSLFVSADAQAADQGYPVDETPWELAPPKLVDVDSLVVCDFTDPATTTDGWIGRSNVTLTRLPDALEMRSSVDDPYFFSPEIDGLPVGKLFVKFRASRQNEGNGQIFFNTAHSDFCEENSAHFEIPLDSEPRDYVVELSPKEPIRRLRFDLGGTAGSAKLYRAEILAPVYEPLRFLNSEYRSNNDVDVFAFTIANESDDQQNAETLCYLSNKTLHITKKIPPRASAEIALPLDKSALFGDFDVILKQKNGKTVNRRFFTYNEKASKPLNAQTDGAILRSGPLAVRFSPALDGAEIFRNGKLVAVVAPLFCEEGDGSDVVNWNKTAEQALAELNDPAPVDAAPARRLVPALRSVSNDGKELELSVCEIPLAEARRSAGKNINRDEYLGASVGFLKFKLDDESLAFEYSAPRKIHAPVVRVLGAMDQAVLPGSEYLEKGEHSSSSADIETIERIRVAPPISWVAQPYASIVTDRVSATLLYDDPKTQPIFAVPDFLDGLRSTDDASRMNLLSEYASGRVRFADPAPIEDSILWAVRQIGLPEIPKRPCSQEEEDARILAAFTQSYIKTPEGWMHACLNNDPPYSFRPSYGSDFLSTIWEISGEAPETPRVDFGGGHIRNYSYYLATCKGELLKNALESVKAPALSSLQEDGSWRYSGKYLRGSDFDYASGHNGNFTYKLLEIWRLTGDKEALEVALKGLEFANKERTPRGAQVWELSIHTPDIMGSSRLVLSNVLAYEATGEEKYLDSARRWAIAGLPFVYLWEDSDLKPWPGDKNPEGEYQPMMRYATIAVFGATSWTSPNWMGRPVQWCGLDYAHALLLLSRYDSTLDWHKIGEGIIASAECQLCLEDEKIGLLPDSFQLDTQERYPYWINPTAVHLLRRMADGRHTSLCVVDANGRRIASPYPAVVDGNKVKITAPKGARYQLLIDGSELREIVSNGEDVVTP